jgi:predicted branched-subunit amino acid permease
VVALFATSQGRPQRAWRSVSMTPLTPNDPAQQRPATFLAGLRTSATSVFSLVLVGTYVGMGALAYDYGFSLLWVMLSTVLVWAGPGQVILISALGAGAAHVDVALAVGLSSVRLMPMVVALLPLIRGRDTRDRELVLPAHFTAASMWVESLRLLPTMPREGRVAFCNGLGVGFMVFAHVGTLIGFYLAASLPLLLSAALLFLTPVSFLVSTARNAHILADRLALGFGLVLGPILAWTQVGLDLVWTGIIAGSAAYALHRLRAKMRGAP